MLSIKKYSLLCILGGEIAYTVCMAYGVFLSEQAAALHLALFQLLPGVTDLGFGSWLAGAVSIAIWSGVFGAYIAWMHNKSLRV